MRSIHVIQRLREKLTEEDVRKIVAFARGGFLLAPDPTDDWQRSADVVAKHLCGRGMHQAAQDFLERQRRMAERRIATLHCRALDGGRFVCELQNGAAEFLVTDGLNVGRFLFKVGASVGNAWQDGLEHDLFVIDHMLPQICGPLATGKVLVEGAEEYAKWLDEVKM